MDRRKNKINLGLKLEKYIKEITKSYNVDKIILFGSYAKGTEHEYSDIDIAVISPDVNPEIAIWENVRNIKEKTNLIDAHLQMTAFSTEVFENESFIDKNFIQEIKRTGKIIYEKKEN